MTNSQDKASLVNDFVKQYMLAYEHFSYLVISVTHCCIVGQINVIQHQTIFFSWMNKPSDASLRRIIPEHFSKPVHTFKQCF